jgi:hypothetical protein
MAVARTEVTGISLPWPAPRCSEGATKAGENGVATSFAARRIGDQRVCTRSERMCL